MKSAIKITLMIVAVLGSAAGSVLGSVFIATDNAGNYAGGSWTNGSNAGIGFNNGWIFNGSGVNQGEFLGASTGNGSSVGTEIDTSGQSWGMFANSGDIASAVRPFSTSLSIGQTVNIAVDNGFVGAGGTVGVGLQEGNGNNRIEFFFAGGNSDYTIQHGATSTDSGIGFTGAGLQLAFTLTGVDTMTLAIQTNNGAGVFSTAATFTGIGLGGDAGSAISQIRLFNANAGNGSGNDAFFNNLTIVPEPSTVMLVGVGLAGAWFMRRRKV